MLPVERTMSNNMCRLVDLIAMSGSFLLVWFGPKYKACCEHSTL